MNIKPNHQSGFTLLEILITIVIMSLGLLGLAGLQALSLRNNQIAYYRGVAAQQAYDMADRIRANQAGVAAGNYDDLNNTTPADEACFSDDQGQAGCSAGDLAITDHRQWNTTNARLLPNGVGTVDCVQGPGVNCNNTSSLRVFAITVQWNERTEAGNANRQFVTRVAP